MEESLHASFPSDAGCDGDFDIPSGSMYMVGSSLSQTDSSSDSVAAEKSKKTENLVTKPNLTLLNMLILVIVTGIV